MAEIDLEELFGDRIVISAEALASALGADVREVRASAQDQGAQMLGAAYAIDRDTAEAICDEFDVDSGDDDDDDDDGDDEDDDED